MRLGRKSQSCYKRSLGKNRGAHHPSCTADPFWPCRADRAFRAGAYGYLALDDDVSEVLRALRSEELTSELQSPCNLVCRLLLEKKMIKTQITTFSFILVTSPVS